MSTSLFPFDPYFSLPPPWKERHCEMASPPLAHSASFCFLQPFSSYKTNLLCSAHWNTCFALWTGVSPDSEITNKASISCPAFNNNNKGKKVISHTKNAGIESGGAASIRISVAEALELPTWEFKTSRFGAVWIKESAHMNTWVM